MFRWLSIEYPMYGKREVTHLEEREICRDLTYIGLTDHVSIPVMLLDANPCPCSFHAHQRHVTWLHQAVGPA